MTFFRLALAAMLMSALPAHGADRTIYLTFDDGPLNGTSNILDVLEAAQVPATLFMVGMHAEASASNKALVRRAKAMPLVTIGNHSYSHAYNPTGISMAIRKAWLPTCSWPMPFWA
ncbi:polysaccharide deacetylase family protein [Mesorhizobium sp. M8A.F.Ca.ET.165.01.1.1]|uniref:polysaccharide deacetylase family protein n=1 Tax=Mesorhizobium sp. M8A.F.Ca.ET.165.01.1.1 TaxID=2563960 RepID=UPI001FE0F3E7|nr:polysaccharide deacetylase family protein [Mesorhizobium sp. M8A.F.Ca.ET.165.01.1.1]